MSVLSEPVGYVEPRREFLSFGSWRAVLRHADRGVPLYYQAPFDASPVLVRVARGGKANPRTLRVRAPEGASAPFDAFVADAGHLDRFRFRASRPSEDSDLGEVLNHFEEVVAARFSEGRPADLEWFLDCLEVRAIELARTNAVGHSQAARLLGYTRDKLRYRARSMGPG